MKRAKALLTSLVLGLATQTSQADGSEEMHTLEKPDLESPHEELFDFPPLSIFNHRHAGEHSETRVLDVPLFSLYRSEHYGDGQYDMRLVDLPLLGSLFRVRRTEREDRTDALFVIRTRREKP